MTILNKLETIRKRRGSVAIALIDPDFKYDNNIKQMISLINRSDFDAIFVGGSKISDNHFDKRLKIIKNSTNLPVIIFPGCSKQISKHADAMLYLSLISGRNPDYLIEEHIKSAPIIHKFSLETIPTAYILLDGGFKSSVQIISNTEPIPMANHNNILAHALAGQYLGKSFIFLETGSGAKKHATTNLIKYLNTYVDIPIIVGGGVHSPSSAKKLVQSGAGYIVSGTKIENLPTLNELNTFTNAIHCTQYHE